MELNNVKVKVLQEDDEEIILEPLSPTGEFFTGSVLSISNLGVLELEIPLVYDSQTPAMSTLLNNVFLPLCPRFSSIIVENDGKKSWKRVEVKVEEHIEIPIFPPKLPPQSYDKYVEEYLSKLAIEKFPQNKPLWQIHIINYQTSNAASTLIFKLHHALGDGFSLMSALLSSLQSARNPSLPLTFPSRKSSQPPSRETFVTKLFSHVFNTVSDFWSGISDGTMEEDDLTPIRSGNEIDFQPIKVSTMTLDLQEIKAIKTKLGVTINDVLTGMVFLGSRLYMQEIDRSSSKARGTAVVLLNTRMMGDYASIQEMIKPNSKMPWGNHFTLLRVPIPKLSFPDEPSNSNTTALHFVHKAQKIIKRKRNSLAIYLTSRLLEFLNKFGGPEAAARYIRRTLKNSSMIISNLIGPVEQMSLANHPVKGLYFLVFGSPEGLDVTIVSYMEKVRIAFKMEKGLIDPQKFKSCMEKAFQMILKASNETLYT